jgi:hypothetical protein
MAQPFGWPASAAGRQDRDQFVVQFDQRRVGIDVDHFNPEGFGCIGGWIERLQRLQHVVAQVAVAARIKGEVESAQKFSVLMTERPQVPDSS